MSNMLDLAPIEHLALAMKCVPAKVDTVGSMQRSLRNTVHESAVAYGIGAQFSHERRMGPGDQHANSAVTWEDQYQPAIIIS